VTDLAWQKLEQFLRHAAPSLATFLLVFLSVTPLPIPSYGAVAPALPMIAIYYWATHRPDLLPFTVVFVAGLLLDILAGGPLGLHSFVFLICHFLVVTQRRLLVGQPFLFLWCGFVVVQLLATFLEWMAFGIYANDIQSIGPVLISGMITMALFPMIAWLLLQMQRGLLRRT